MATVNQPKNNGVTNARRYAYERLREMVVCSEIAAGERLGEVPWAEKLDVHRGAVREAFAMLHHEGLLVKHGRSFSVPILSEQDVIEIYQVRSALEISAIQMAIQQRIQKENLDSLKMLCDTMDHLIDANLPIGFSEADKKFHTELVKLSGNSRLVHIYQLAPLPHAKTMGAFLNRPDILQKAQNEHRQFLEALSNGDNEKAIATMQIHLNDRLKKISSTIKPPKYIQRGLKEADALESE